jgi:hypothetical protein
LQEKWLPVFRPEQRRRCLLAGLRHTPTKQRRQSNEPPKKNARHKALQLNASDPISGDPAAASYRARIASSQDFDRAGE